MAKVTKEVLPADTRLNSVALEGEDMVLSRQVSSRFMKFAGLLKVDKQNFFRQRAVKRAAANVLRIPLIDYLKQDKLEAIPGIGKELTEKIKEIHDTDKCKDIDDLEAKHPDWEAKLTKPKAKKKIETKFYYAYDEASTEDMYGPENWTQENAERFGTPNVFVIIPRTAWDEEERWDDGSDEYGDMCETLHDIGIGESSECIYEIQGTVAEAEEILENLGGFEKNESIVSDNY